jgi:hypothetical protein
MKAPALPIRQRLSALTCLKAGPKAVLIEVCELHENGGKGCYMSNDTLAKKLGVSLATATRTIGSLVGWGLLYSTVIKAEANRRYLSPSATVRACYASPSSAEQLAAVCALTIVKIEPEQVLTIVNPVADYSQNGELTIVKNVTDYSQTASRVYGDDQDDQFNDQDDQPAALALAQKKIAGLTEELSEAFTDLAACRATIADLRAQLENEKKRGAATRVGTSVAALPYTSEEFAAKWQAFRTSQGIAAGSARETALLETLQGVAATNEVLALSCLKKSIEMGWKTFYKPDEPRTQSSQQSERGAKPTAAAATGARALAERLALIDEQQRQERIHERRGGLAAGAYTGQGPH